MNALTTVPPESCIVIEAIVHNVSLQPQSESIPKGIPESIPKNPLSDSLSENIDETHDSVPEVGGPGKRDEENAREDQPDKAPTDEVNKKLKLEDSCCKTKGIPFLLNAIRQFAFDHKKRICCGFHVILFVGITIYMVAAMIRDLQRALPLFVVWCLVVTYWVYLFLSARYGKKITRSFKPLFKKLDKRKFWIKLSFVAFLIIGFIVWIAINTSQRSNQLISATGYFVFLFGLLVFSRHPDKIIWRPVFLGLVIQVFCAILILRTQAGFNAFAWLGSLTNTFMNYVDNAVVTLFGKTFFKHYIAFKVLPVIIFFNAFNSIMYYFGVMQWLILKIAWLMHFSLNTSATETLVAAGNIFIGQSEAPLFILPYVPDLTISEFHALTVTGFGTISISVFGVFVDFGIKPVYLISACVMSAPCALAVSKLMFPETETSYFASWKDMTLAKSTYKNIVEAGYSGASQALPMVISIAGNIIAFLSLLAVLNQFLAWFGGLLDFPRLSFEVISSYVFVPVAFLMGINWEDCFKAAELLGTKIFLNEFIAFKIFGTIIEKRDSGVVPHINASSGSVNWLDERSEAIMTYALCGFSNFGSVGIMLGALGTMAPKRQRDVAKVMMSSLVCGAFVNILNGCVAGFFYVPRPIVCVNMLAATNWSYTDPSRLYECCSAEIQSETRNNTTVKLCCDHNWDLKTFHLDCVTAWEDEAGGSGYFSASGA